MKSDSDLYRSEVEGQRSNSDCRLWYHPFRFPLNVLFGVFINIVSYRFTVEYKIYYHLE